MISKEDRDIAIEYLIIAFDEFERIVKAQHINLIENRIKELKKDEDKNKDIILMLESKLEEAKDLIGTAQLLKNIWSNAIKKMYPILEELNEGD